MEKWQYTEARYMTTLAWRLTLPRRARSRSV
jgi:hypothetical protein